MSTSRNEGLVRTLYEALAAQDYETTAQHLSENVTVRNMATGDVYVGKAGFLEFVRGWAAAFPDLRYVHLKVGATDTSLVAEYEFEGTHTGPLVTPRGHVPATIRPVQVRFCDVLEVEDGLVAHLRSYFDSITLLRQLGLGTGTLLHAPERRAPIELYAQPVETYVPQRNKAIVQRFVNDVFNRRNPLAVFDTCAKPYSWHGGSLGEARGLGAYQNVLGALFAAFPDLLVEVQDSIAESDKVVLRFMMTGTHLGDFQGIAPTFKRIVSEGTSTYRLDESRIVEEWWQGDILGLLQQINAAPPTVPRAP